jgi:hypothetical protein
MWNRLRLALQNRPKHRWESKLIDHASHYLTRKEGLSRDLATEVRLLAWARTGQWEDAAWEWERILGEARLGVQAENLKTAALGNELAIEAQLAGKIEIAQDIYKNLSRRFFINQGIQTLCKTKLAKLELVGKAAPANRCRRLGTPADSIGGPSGSVAPDRFLGHGLPALPRGLSRVETLA